MADFQGPREFDKIYSTKSIGKLVCPDYDTQTLKRVEQEVGG